MEGFSFVTAEGSLTDSEDDEEGRGDDTGESWPCLVCPSNWSVRGLADPFLSPPLPPAQQSQSCRNRTVRGSKNGYQRLTKP